jgi:predicted RNase H-like HicB family nuclease
MNTTRKVQTAGPARDVASYLNAPYVRMLIPDSEEGGYIAEVLELPGCVTDGETPQEALRNLEEAMTGWIRASLDHGKPIPEPVGMKEYSGHFPLRMSTELHRAAALRAMQEEVSLNQWIVKAIAAQVAEENLVEDLAEQVAAKVVERISVEVFSGVGVKVTGMIRKGSTSAELTRTRLDPEMEGTATVSRDTAVALLGRGLPDIVFDAIEAGRKVSENA